jgi:ribulose-phosphate 3-epimerase
MTLKIGVIPAIIPRDLKQLWDQIVAVVGYSTEVHVDVNDGIFTHTISWPFTEPGISGDDVPIQKPLHMEAHLMVKNPGDVAHELARGCMSRLIFHPESFASEADALSTFSMCRQNHVEIGIAATAATTPMELYKYESECSFFHFMLINEIGHFGEKLQPELLEKVKEVHNRWPNKLLSADGGINKDNVGDVIRAGVSRVIVGSAIAQSGDMPRSYQEILAAAESAV